MIRFAIISDTHIGRDETYRFRGIPTARSARTLVDALARLSPPPEFVLHAGDVCGDKEDHAGEEHYRLAREIFSRVRCPIHYVSGNHDETGDLTRVLDMPEVAPLTTNSEKLAYRFECRGREFVVLDARLARRREGVLDKEQLDALGRILGRCSSPVCVFLHYPVLKLDSTWMDEHMLVTNGAELHALLAGYRERVVAVFHGHSHHFSTTVCDGIAYVACPSSLFQFELRPDAASSATDLPAPPAFCLVTLEATRFTVKSFALPATE